MTSPWQLLACTKYGDRAASVRQRYLQYASHLQAAGIELRPVPLLDNSYLDATFSGRSASKLGVAKCYLSRFGSMLRARKYDGLWLQYELFPYAPAFMETLALSNGTSLIIDLDDAIFHQYDQHKSPFVRALLGGKLKPLLRRADLAICGNPYLEAYAVQFCRRTEIVPTVVDTDAYGPAEMIRPETQVTIGWIGSPSTWRYVEPLAPMLSSLAEELNLKVVIVGAGPQKVTPPRFEFHPWSEASEISLIRSMDIGIMPLPDEPWARGKCGYKLIQYMACGLPVIASPVGVNAQIVEEGINGFFARTPADWVEAIRRLACDADLRRAMGRNGRRKIQSSYSLAVHGPRLAGMLREVMEAGQPRRARCGS